MTSRQEKLIENYIRTKVKSILKEDASSNEIIQSFSDWILEQSRTYKMPSGRIAVVVLQFIKQTYKIK